MKDECEFCELLKLYKTIAKNETKPKDIRIIHRYRVRLVVDTYRAGINHAGRLTERPMPLRYCPMCGEKLKRERNDDTERTIG